MAKIIPVGQPVNDSEREAIKYLRDNLPESYTIIHNFEIPQGRERFETHIPHFNLKHEEITVKIKVKRAGKLSSKHS